MSEYLKMIKMLLKFSTELMDIDGYYSKTDENFTLFDIPASYGGISPSEIVEGCILSKCTNCNKLQFIKFENVISVFSHGRQMGPEIQYVDTISVKCCNCGIEEDDVEIEFWEYPEYETYIESMSFDKFKIDLKCTDYLELIIDNIELLDESSKESIKEEILEASKIKNNSEELTKEIEKLNTMVNNPTSKESNFQQFFEKNYWMFGVDYVGATPTEKMGDKNIPDFLLERYDGFHDILDLKLPIPNLFKKIGNKLHPRHELNDGCSQIEYYIGYSNENTNESDKIIYRPQGILIIGRSNSNEKDRLRQYNDDHPKVRVMTYDDIIQKATNILKTIHVCNSNNQML